MEDEKLVDLNTVIIGLFNGLEQRKDIDEELNKKGLAKFTIETEYYTGTIIIKSKEE